MENILVWHWLTVITCGQNIGVALTGITCGQNIGVALTVTTRRKKDWCGTGWQLLPIEKRLVWHWLTVITYGKILVWHCDWLTVITYGKNIRVALTELLPVEKNIGVALWLIDSYHLWKKYWCGTDWAITSSCGKKYWCGTDWAITCGKNIGVALTELSHVEKILVWHWLSYYLRGKHWCGTDCYHLWREKNIGVALTDSCQLWKQILVWH